MLNQKRVAERMEVMRGISAPGKGINRLAFTEADRDGIRQLMEWMQEAGLTIRMDAFGNVLGRRVGTDESLPAVMIGSHSDSVPDGGNYDGLVGVMTAIEMAQSMKEDGFMNDRTLETVIFRCEESSRFSAATLGSKAMRGQLSTHDLQVLQDRDGRSLYEVLQEVGAQPEEIGKRVYDEPLMAMLEMHIEQGKSLEHKGVPIGIVTGIAAPYRMRIHLHGHPDHSGATPMALRHDGLCAAAEVILHVEQAAKASMVPVVGTVGVIQIAPNAMNVIPGEVQLGIDIRSIQREARQRVVEDILGFVKETCEKRQISYEVETLADDDPVPLPTNMVDFLAKCSEEEGYPCVRMMSGAGHDAMHWAAYCPTGMVFIPCKDGVSHAPEEYARLEDIMKGMGVMERAVRRLCEKNSTLIG